MEQRKFCPICNEHRGEVEFSICYDSSKIKEFFNSFYGDRRNIESRINMEFFHGEKLIIRYCPKCKFYWHEYILGKDGMIELYEQWTDPNYSRQQRNDWSRRRSSINKALYIEGFFKGKKKPEELRVLDFGMGWGGYLMSVNALGSEAHGVEISKVRRDSVKNKNIKTYADLSELDGKFDVIASHQTFEHVPNPKKTLSSLVEMLNPDGFLHINTPIAKGKPNMSRVLRKGPFTPPEHINGFTPHSIVRLVNMCNLVPVPMDQRCYNPKGSIKQRVKYILSATNTLWLYDILKWQKTPNFFTPAGSDLK